MDRVADDEPSLAKHLPNDLEDLRNWLGAILWADVLIFDAEFQALRTRTVWHICWIEAEGVIDHLPVFIDCREPSATFLVAPDFVVEDEALAVNGDQPTWGEKMETRCALISTATPSRWTHKLPDTAVEGRTHYSV